MPGVLPRMEQDAFNGLAGEIVRRFEPHTESSREALLLDFLTCFGNAVGMGPKMIVDGTVHRPRLFCLICGSTSRSRKGTSRANIRRLMAQVDPDWSEHRVISGLSSGEGLISLLSPIGQDDDDEARLPMDPRLLIVETEFSRVLKVAQREGSILSEVLRQAWDDDTISTYTRKSALKATGHVSIIGHTTVEELHRYITSTEIANGFGNRFLFALVERSQRLPNGGNLTEGDIEALASDVGKALADARQVEQMSRSGLAEEMWENFYYVLPDDVLGIVGALSARIEAQMVRLSMIYALLDGLASIEPRHIRSAGDVWDYCGRSLQSIFGSFSGDAIADKLYKSIAAEGSAGLDETGQSDALGRHIPAARLNLARQLLLDQELVTRVVINDTGGRPRTVYRQDIANKAKYRLPVAGTPGGVEVSSLLSLSSDTNLAHTDNPSGTLSRRPIRRVDP